MENTNTNDQKAAAEKSVAEKSAAEKSAAEKSAAGAKSKAVDAVFAANPTLDVYYKTSDGTPFFTRNAAELHAAGLKGKSVEKMSR
jgi:membrane protein involved in colicin uptake